MLDVLEGVQQLDEPRSLDGSQDVSFDQDMLDFIHLCKCAFSHLFQGTYFPGIDLSREVDGSVASLTDLSNDSELVDPEFCSSLSEQDTFSTVV